jgi:hypothetical protein
MTMERFVACLKVKARIQSVVEVSPTQAIAASLCDPALPIDIRTATRHDDIAGSRHLHRRRQRFSGSDLWLTGLKFRHWCVA